MAAAAAVPHFSQSGSDFTPASRPSVRPSVRSSRVPSSVCPSVFSSIPMRQGNLPRPPPPLLMMLLSCTSKAAALIHKFDAVFVFSFKNALRVEHFVTRMNLRHRLLFRHRLHFAEVYEPLSARARCHAAVYLISTWALPLPNESTQHVTRRSHRKRSHTSSSSLRYL